MRRRLAGILLAGAAVTVIAGCGDDDGADVTDIGTEDDGTGTGTGGGTGTGTGTGGGTGTGTGTGGGTGTTEATGDAG